MHSVTDKTADHTVYSTISYVTLCGGVLYRSSMTSSW